MQNFYFYQGDHKQGFKHLITICMDSLSKADVEFEAMFNLESKNLKNCIVVTLKPKD